MKVLVFLAFALLLVSLAWAQDYQNSSFRRGKNPFPNRNAGFRRPFNRAFSRNSRRNKQMRPKKSCGRSVKSFRQLSREIPQIIRRGGQIIVKSLKMYRKVVQRFGRNIPIVLRRTVIRQNRQCNGFCSPRRIIIRRRISDPMMQERAPIVKTVYVPKPVYLPTPAPVSTDSKKYILHTDNIVVKCSHPVDPKIVAQNYKPLPPPVKKDLDLVSHEVQKTTTTTSTTSASITTVIPPSPAQLLEKISKECDESLKKNKLSKKEQKKQKKSKKEQKKSKKEQKKEKKQSNKKQQKKDKKQKKQKSNIAVEYKLPKKTDPLVAKTIQRSLDLKQLVKIFQNQGKKGKELKKNIISIAHTSKEAAKIQKKVQKHQKQVVSGRKSFDDLLQYIGGVVTKGKEQLKNKHKKPHARKMFSVLSKLTKRMNKGRVTVDDFMSVVKSFKTILPQRKDKKSIKNARKPKKSIKHEEEEELDDDDEKYSFL